MSNLELHPLCTYFPRMSDSDFDGLKSDIKNNGQIHPIIMLDGMILDGGNRYRALCELGISPICEEYTGNNPVQFVLSSNLHRRHLTQGQAAAIVSATQDWAKAHPSHRVKEGCNVAPLSTVADRVLASGAGKRTQQEADKLVKNAPNELVKQVTNGEKSLNQALVEAELKPERKSKNQSATLHPYLSVDEEEQNHNEPSLHDIIDDLQAMNKELESENRTLVKTMESEDKVASLLHDIKVLTATNSALNSRLNGMNVERTEMIRRIKWLEKQLKKHAPAVATVPSGEVDAWE